MEDTTMTKIFYSILMAATLLVAAVATTGCKKDEPQQQAKVQKFRMSIQASKGENGDKANGPRKVLGLDGSTLTAAWAEGEQVTVYNETKDADLGGYLEAQEAGSSTLLDGELTGTIEAGDKLTLKFRSPSYTTQEGTLEYISANCDYAIAEHINVKNVDGGSIYSDDVADFVNQQAIVKFSLTDGSDAINVNPLVVEVASSTYTITPASATDQLYVALPGFSSQTISMTATVGSDTYTFEKSGVTLANGRYYTITVNMSKLPPIGAINGLFSVGESTQVYFSKGNLQYQASTGTWRFAENQYDMIGNDNTNVSASYTGWIDLFGWGTGDNPTNTSNTPEEYTPFVDWGTNAISNGGNEANQWRTLTKDEWIYLFTTRDDAATLFGLGTVNDVNGTILLPDNWVLPAGASFTASSTQGLEYKTNSYSHGSVDHFVDNTYTIEQWSVMESAGAVFFPAAGYRNAIPDMFNVGTHGYYWSTTTNGSGQAFYFNFYSSNLRPWNYNRRDFGQSVRLVR